MKSNWTTGLLLLLPVIANIGTAGLAAQSRDSEYGQAIRGAVALLPRRPARVFVIDVNDAKPQDRPHLSRLQAFIIKGSPVVYLTKHGDVLRGAVEGSRFSEYILATVIWHEMAHAEGADEPQARRREEELWTRFILENVVDRGAALNYLAALKRRQPIDGIR